MNEVFKLLLMCIFFAAALLAGYKLYGYLNNKVMECNTWLQLAGWTAALFAGLGGLFMLTMYLLIVAYDYLASVRG